MNEIEKIAREAAEEVCIKSGLYQKAAIYPQDCSRPKAIIMSAITRATEGLRDRQFELASKLGACSQSEIDLRAQLAAANERVKEAKQAIQREVDQSDCAACRVFLSGVIAALSTPATKEEKR